MDERPPRKRKLFVGIALDAQARAACAAVVENVRKTGLAAKYEAPEKLHATLAFLGFVEPPRVEDVTAGMEACAQRSQPFRVNLDKLGAFPHERRPRVVYIGAREQGAPFRTLAENVRNAYAALGFDFKNDPVAHVTIARVKESKCPLPLLEFAPIALEIRELALFESLPDPAHRTSRYEIIARVTLSGDEN
jgi:RNA 2',3'-cyclic 3'-phosphodiesterase